MATIRDAAILGGREPAWLISEDGVAGDGEGEKENRPPQKRQGSAIAEPQSLRCGRLAVGEGALGLHPAGRFLLVLAGPVLLFEREPAALLASVPPPSRVRTLATRTRRSHLAHFA